MDQLTIMTIGIAIFTTGVCMGGYFLFDRLLGPQDGRARRRRKPDIDAYIDQLMAGNGSRLDREPADT